MLDMETAVKLDPKISEPYEDYAFLLKKFNRNQEARIFFKKAIELDPENNQLLTNFSHLELALENYRQGWQLFESRWKVKNLKQIPTSFCPEFHVDFSLMNLAFKATESDMWNRSTPEVGQTSTTKYDSKLFSFSLVIRF